MREDDLLESPLRWINRLTKEPAVRHLEDRGLDTAGILPTLRARLARFEEKSIRKKMNDQPTPPPPPPAIEIQSASPQGDQGATPRDKATGREDPFVSLGAYNFPPDPHKTWGETYQRAPPPRIEYPPRHDRGNTRGSAAEAYNIMRKWNLHFSGQRGSDAEAFLLRIKEARSIIHVDDAELFKCLPLFLSGTALYWVRLESENWRDWRDFEHAWRSRFGDPDYLTTLREEIQRRTQGEHEPAVEYLTCLRSLFTRMSPPWSLPEQLTLAHRNLLPRLQFAIRRWEFSDFHTLEDLATRTERTLLADKMYRPPLLPEQSLFPDLAYHAPQGKPRSPNTVAAGEAVAQGDPSRGEAWSAAASTDATIPRSVPDDSNLKCWNCDQTGHRARTCRAARRQHCYRCGNPGFTTRTCPRCSGNAKGGQ
ncbi:uncharacterized protein LOC143908456 [Temnothorax americanus]|uniref:uncharacterized protein LOC143908456 n=1 Tax=Temnothorax americanus TaxID=1964332 RepID=UPI004069016E